MVKIRINERRSIGDGEPVFIIAEAGANHNRDKKLAFELIDAAADAKADAIKFQIYSANTLYSKEAPRFSKDSLRPWDLIKAVETPRNWIPELKEYSDKKGLIFFATPFDFDAVDELEAVGTEIYKIASFEIVDLDLIHYVSSKQKPTIISTGLSNLEEIEDAYLAYKSTGNNKLVFLQCASLYPSKPEIMNLRAITSVRSAFNTITGLSDHTVGIHISVAAVAMGASVIEKHFTLDRNMKGPDHPFAVEPNELSQMISNIRDTEKAFGDGLKIGPSAEEQESYEKGRRSIHAKRTIHSGETIGEDMLCSKRPGYGIKPKYKQVILGCKALREIPEDKWITWKDILG